MSASEELRGYSDEAGRYQKRLARDKAQREEMIQEILAKITVETRDIIKQKTTEVEKEIIDLLGPDLETLLSDVQKIKNTLVTRKEMAEFFDNFDKFLNEFSHIEGYIQDPNAKNKLHNAVEEMRDTIARIKGWIKGD